MNKIKLNNLTETYKALEDDLIAPQLAIKIISLALALVDLEEERAVSKKDVLNQIKNLDKIVSTSGERPVYFWQKEVEFNIKDIYTIK